MKNQITTIDKSNVVSNDTFNRDEHLQELICIVETHNQEVNKVKKMLKALPKKERAYFTDRSMNIYNNTDNLLECVIDINDYTMLEDTTQLSSIFPFLMGIVLNTNEVDISLTAVSRNMSEILLKDKVFKNYLINALNRGAVYSYMGTDILSILFSYVFQDKKITISRIKDFLSWYLVKSNSILHILNDLTDEQKIVLEQIKTGVKYKKEKNMNPANREDYKRKDDKHFSLKNITDQYIKIKYISKKEYKHMFHKRPAEHLRDGHFRYYKNGKVVWIDTTVINQGVA